MGEGYGKVQTDAVDFGTAFMAPLGEKRESVSAPLYVVEVLNTGLRGSAAAVVALLG